MPIPKQPCKAKQKKYGLIGKIKHRFYSVCQVAPLGCLLVKHLDSLSDKVAPQESDDEDDRKPFPSTTANTTTTSDPTKGGDQSKTNFKIFLCSALLSAFLNGINDCDETYNYW